MQTKINAESLLRAAKAHLISFKELPSSPVIMGQLNNSSNETLNEVVKRYNKYGFAIVHITSEVPTSHTVISLGELFNLGEPFIPPLYTKGGYKASPIAKISLQGCSTAHPTFQREVGVQLHCDGTLQEIGVIKTSVLLCESPGAKGGNSILFNATAAYAELLEIDLDAAVAMAAHGSLVRQANMNGCSDKNVGQAFSIADGKLICAYSVTETDKFVATADINADDLSRGVKFMHEASQPGSPYYCQVRLEKNQAIIFSNTKLSHGRMPYRNSPGTRRCLFRGLFLNYPMAVQEKLKAVV